jgi:hypothetical protein
MVFCEKLRIRIIKKIQSNLLSNAIFALTDYKY